MSKSLSYRDILREPVGIADNRTGGVPIPDYAWPPPSSGYDPHCYSVSDRYQGPKPKGWQCGRDCGYCGGCD